jgi:hypothetical protein
MPFASGPVLAYVGLGQYRTVGPTVYVGAKQVFSIPDGFATDLASVPRFFWSLLPPDGRYEKAAVLHDWLCTELARARAGGPPAPATGRDTDALFRRVMAEGGVGFVTRWIMWCGVRWGAAKNPARSARWWADAPLVAGITALELAALAAVVVWLHVLVDALLGLVL